MTPPFPLNIRVYQGDPLSIALFITVINTLSDTLSTRKDLGTLSQHPPPQPVTLFMLITSVSLVTHLLDADTYLMVNQWLQWSLLDAKVPKCRALSFQASTGRKVDPGLSLGGLKISVVLDEDFSFLEMPVRVCSSNVQAQNVLLANFNKMLQSVDESPITHPKKLCLYKLGIYLRLSWALFIEEFPLTWLERCLQLLATRGGPS